MMSRMELCETNRHETQAALFKATRLLSETAHWYYNITQDESETQGKHQLTEAIGCALESTEAGLHVDYETLRDVLIYTLSAIEDHAGIKQPAAIGRTVLIARKREHNGGLYNG